MYRTSYNQGSFTSADRQSVKLPDKISCRICHKFKGPEQFSKGELTKFSYKAMQFGGKSQVRCRMCTGGAPAEIKCLGPCGEFKKVELFSKTSRKAGGQNWCQACTTWKTSLQCSESMDPAEASEVAEQDHDEDLSTLTTVGSGFDSDPETGDWSDSDYGTATIAPDYMTSTTTEARPNRKAPSSSYMSVPYEHLSALKIDEDGSAISAQSWAPAAAASGSVVTSEARSYRDAESVISITTESGSNDYMTQSSISNPFASSSGTATTQAGKIPVRFMAYDNQGVAHPQVAYTTAQSNNAGSKKPQTTGTLAPQVRVSKSGWAKPATKRWTEPSMIGDDESDVLQSSVSGQHQYDPESDGEEDLM